MGTTDRHTDRQTNIATYRAAIAAKNLSFNTSNTIYTLPTTYIHYQQHNTSMRLVADRPTDQPTDRQTNIVTYRAAITANAKYDNRMFS